jgi:excisionase family DNA binding protein
MTPATQNPDNHDSDQPSLDELISLRDAAELSGLSSGHLRLLVRRGEIWGVKLGRNWVTTAKALEEYMARDRRPGPKPKKRHDQSSI